MIENPDYDRVFIEAQRNYVATDPYGERFNIWQGMQFKFIGYVEKSLGCGSCGTKKKEKMYIIDAWASCPPGEYIWQTSDGKSGLTIEVPERFFIETDSYKYPPIINEFARESSGTDTEMFKRPKDRKIPRDGGLWYDDPWYTKRNT